ncbi:MAG: Uma2 family endonuclease [Bacteroidetes bacterium QH_2_63_10]|nr:MAG: Uma2 family endonuclease [Bacteroidetes bacterium QH_2_63_10]
MPITTTTAKDHQARWQEIARDPVLRDLSYKVETNVQGQLIVSPHQNSHSFLQASVRDLLQEQASEGVVVLEFAIATEQGVKVPDVIWTSPERRDEMEATGDPTTLAPEICIEVMSDTNTEEEMQQKRSLYLQAGAEEVWVVDGEGRVRFFGEADMERSSLVPGYPTRV